VVERVEVERAELGSPFQIRHDVLGLGFRGVLGETEKVRGPAGARIGCRGLGVLGEPLEWLASAE
jgi:hypothetical protein